MKPFVRTILSVALATVLLAGAFAVMPTEAKAVTTSYLSRQIALIKTQITSIVRTNTSQNSAINGLKSRTTKAEATGTALAGRVTSLESSNTALLALVNTLTGGSGTLLTRVSSLETSNTSLFSVLGNVQSALNVLTGRMAAVETTQAQLLTRMNAAETAQSGLAARVTTLESASGTSSFWPPIAVGVSSDPTMTAETNGSGIYYVMFGIQPAVDGERQSLRESYLIVRHGSRVLYQGTGGGFPSTLASMPPDGSTVDVEYWFETHGRQLHGFRTFVFDIR